MTTEADAAPRKRGLLQALAVYGERRALVMLALGFRTAEQGWVWKGKRAGDKPDKRRKKPDKPRPGNAFGALAALRV